MTSLVKVLNIKSKGFQFKASNFSKILWNNLQSNCVIFYLIGVLFANIILSFVMNFINFFYNDLCIDGLS